MATELSKTYALQCLTAAGFSVEEIPRHPNEKRADLHVRWDNEEYLVEAKLKEESRKWLEFIENVHGGGSGAMSREIAPWPKIAAVIKDANDQLVATPANATTFRILWFVSLHDDDEFVMECIKCQLFGLQKVSVMEEKPASRWSFYHTYSDFRRYPDVDGAVLAVRKGQKLCVNSFSCHYKAFRTTKLYGNFQEIGALCDPSILEKKGEAFVIGSDFTERPTGRPQWEYLRKKYGVRTSVMQRSRFDGRFTLPDG